MDNQEQQKENKQNINIEMDNDKMWGIVAYIIFFLPLIFVKNRSAFLNYHINQGIILFIVSLIGNIIFKMSFGLLFAFG